MYRDAHGDVLAAYSTTSTKLVDYSYDAWGNQLAESETSAFANNPLRYNGQYYDCENDLIYLRARYYDSSTGRFITEDPAKDGLNWFVYSGNNPVAFVDPSGLKPLAPFSTRDEAAADFGMYIGQQSIDEGEVYFSFIFCGTDENDNVYYYYDNPRNDYTAPEDRSKGFRFNKFEKTAVAIVHTHGAYDADTGNTKDGFSSPGNSLDANFSDTSESDRFGVDYYVVTPVGNLYRYDTQSGNYAGTLIRSDMPVDSRIVIHNNIIMLVAHCYGDC